MLRCPLFARLLGALLAGLLGWLLWPTGQPSRPLSLPDNPPVAARRGLALTH